MSKDDTKTLVEELASISERVAYHKVCKELKSLDEELSQISKRYGRITVRDINIVVQRRFNEAARKVTEE